MEIERVMSWTPKRNVPGVPRTWHLFGPVVRRRGSLFVGLDVPCLDVRTACCMG